MEKENGNYYNGVMATFKFRRSSGNTVLAISQMPSLDLGTRTVGFYAPVHLSVTY